MPTDADRPSAREVVAALIERDETVATAESLTAGLLCVTLTDVPGASAAVRGGLVVYATDLKTSLAGIDESLLTEYGPVHPEIATELADAARLRCGATWGVGLTGVAGPDPQGGVAAGTVYVGLCAPTVRTTRPLRLPGDRAQVRHGTVREALDLLLARLGEQSG